MWLFTKLGFFSIVQKPNDELLTVRARVATDLDSLRKEFMPQLSPTISGEGTDYPFRAKISHHDFASGVSKLSEAINYSNFKNEVANKMGNQRAHAYSKV